MERPEFKVTISKTGKVQVEIKGVKGKRCIELADLIAEIVGREDERRMTSDFHALEGHVRIDTKVRNASSG